MHWVKTGAQPTDTCKALLSYKGVVYKNHLDKGVLKGAMTQEQADKKFAAWLEEKAGKIDGKKDNLAKAADADAKARFTAEQDANAKKAAEVAAKNTPPVEEVVEEAAPEVESAVEEAPVAEATPEVVEEPKAEVATEEAPAKEEEKKDAE